MKKTIALVTPNMHSFRRRSLMHCVESIVKGASVTVTSIGRGVHSKVSEKHKIKRADRLLSNSALHQEVRSIYKALCKYTVGQTKRPVILVDWSDLDEYKRHFLIRATLVSNKRGLCLYEEIHNIKTKEKPSTHHKFLQRLSELLHDQCKPIIVTDAGFKTPWFREVLALNWDFVGRARLPNFYSKNGSEWQCITQLYKRATSTAKAFSGYIARRNPLKCQLILVKQKPKGRKKLNRSGQPCSSKHAKTHIKSARDPWLIATSLTMNSSLPNRIVKIYRCRMQIEEGFRDMKSKQFGLGFEQNKTTNQQRMVILILLATLAQWFLMILGKTLHMLHKHREYQSY